MKKYAFEFDSIEKAQKTYCSGFTNCGECPFRPFALSPFKEDCTEYAAQHPDKAAELMGLKVVEDKGDPIEIGKPRLAEILGVEVGEKFRISLNGGSETFKITADGHFKTYPPNQADSTYLLLDAINHPEIIIRQPRLTPEELAICKTVGAKWVERPGEPVDYQVHLWSENPDKSMNKEEENRIRIGGIRAELFPSVRPGDLVNVEEILKEAEA